MFLSLGNVSIQYAWAFIGLSVAQVITSRIAVVIGTSLNYFLNDKINKASILFPGVACILTVVLLGASVHSSNAADNVAKLRSFHENMKDIPEYAILILQDVPEDSSEKGGKSEKGNTIAVSMIQSSLYDYNFGRASTKSSERVKMQTSVVVLASEVDECYLEAIAL